MKRITTVVLICCLLILMVPPSITYAFVDANSHWAKNSIERLVTYGALQGYPDGTFKPDSEVTKAELATVLTKAFHLQTKDPVGLADTKGHWAYLNIGACQDLIYNYDSSRFEPDSPATREQVGVAIARCLDLKKKFTVSDQTLGKFIDWKEITTGLVNDMAFSVEGGILKGYPDNSIKPHRTVTRAEAATMIDRPLYSTPLELKINPPINELLVGRSQQFELQYRNAYGQWLAVPDDSQISWSSLKTSGSISANGAYLGTKPGEETISGAYAKLKTSRTLEIIIENSGATIYGSFRNENKLSNGLVLKITEAQMNQWTDKWGEILDSYFQIYAILSVQGYMWVDLGDAINYSIAQELPDSWAIYIDVAYQNTSAVNLAVSTKDFYVIDDKKNRIDGWSLGDFEVASGDASDKFIVFNLHIPLTDNSLYHSWFEGYKLIYQPPNRSNPLLVIDLQYNVKWPGS